MLRADTLLSPLRELTLDQNCLVKRRNTWRCMAYICLYSVSLSKKLTRSSQEVCNLVLNTPSLFSDSGFTLPTFFLFWDIKWQPWDFVVVVLVLLCFYPSLLVFLLRSMLLHSPPITSNPVVSSIHYITSWHKNITFLDSICESYSSWWRNSELLNDDRLEWIKKCLQQQKNNKKGEKKKWRRRFLKNVGKINRTDTLFHCQ